MKLTTSELKNHLLRNHSSNRSVCAAYLLDEAQKMVNVTPRQSITKYTKATSKQEGHMDHYIRDSYHGVNLNRALTHWLSCANLPYNMPSRPYIQRNFLDTGYAAATKMLSVFFDVLGMHTISAYGCLLS